MTKQQALDRLNLMRVWYEDYGTPDADYDAICYAIGVIEEMPEGTDTLIKALEQEHKKLLEMQKAQPEKLTDIEQRIFLAAMSKEEKVCREVDKEPSDAECINLMRVCKSIERKVKGALWT